MIQFLFNVCVPALAYQPCVRTAWLTGAVFQPWLSASICQVSAHCSFTSTYQLPGTWYCPSLYCTLFFMTYIRAFGQQTLEDSSFQVQVNILTSSTSPRKKPNLFYWVVWGTVGFLLGSDSGRWLILQRPKITYCIRILAAGIYLSQSRQHMPNVFDVLHVRLFWNSD